MNARRLISVTLTTLGVIASGLLFAGAPAQAASVRSQIGAFGPGGPGVGVFSKPQSITVEQGTGDVFVYDVGEGGRVYKFDAAGNPVDFSSTSTNVIEGVGGGAKESQITVDSSSGPDKGDIYVDTGQEVLIYNGSTGAKLATFITGEGEPCGVAVDPSGGVYVSFYEEIKKYTPVTSPVTTADYTSSLPEVPGVCNIAVDSAGDVYAAPYGGEEAVIKYEASQFNVLEVPAIGTAVEAEGATLAVDPSSGVLYVDELSDIAGLSSSGTRIESFGALSKSFGVAKSHGSGDVYAAGGEASEVVIFGPGAVLPEVSTGSVTELHETSATLNGTVNPEETSVTKCEFEYGTNTSYAQSEPCSKAVPFTGDSPIPVSANLTGLQSGATYDFRLSATNPNGTEEATGTFETPGPTISEESVANVGSTSADLHAQIDPRGAETSYYFQYGTTTSYGASIPAPPGVDIGSGTTDEGVVQALQGLAPGSTYHYRVVSIQDAEESYGLDQTFTTQPAGGKFVLPDGRAWEMVSPPNKHGSGLEPMTREGGVIQASVDGSAITYLATAPVNSEPVGNRAPEFSQVLSKRVAGGWETQDIPTPHNAASLLAIGDGSEYRLFSSNLSLGLVEPRSELPPSPEAAERTPYLPLSPEATERTPYLRDDATGGYLPLVTAANVLPGTKFGEGRDKIEGGTEIEGATPDLSHVVLEAEVPLTANAVGQGLYEWAAGKLQLVSVLPGVGEEPAAEGRLGDEDKDVRSSISADGSRIVWEGSEEARARPHLYMRDMTTQETVQLDAPAQGAPENHGEQNSPTFQTASSDDSKVFFTDAEQLTEDSTAATREPDLYECEIVEGPGGLACDLRDLTVDEQKGGHADVQGTVLGASEDGSYVYFVANGVLAAGAAPGTCEGEFSGAETCNLYVRHEGTTTFIAALSGQDQPDWGAVTSRVSANGRYLAFMSDRSLTGYDNRDASSGEPDEEVYLYDAESKRVICASCDPTGARPVGLFEAHNGDPLFDHEELWGERWLAGNLPGWTKVNIGKALYQSRYLSDSGRLFFDSTDALVPQDINGLEDVYEFEPGGVGSCEGSGGTFSETSGGCVGLVSSGSSNEESAFLDASESGDDAFFLTTARLTDQDGDKALDVYDARVCSAAEPCPSEVVAPPSCATADSCRAASAPQPAIFGAPSSATFSGPGNPAPGAPKGAMPKAKARPLTRAQKLVKALKACKKRPKRKRSLCEAQARKRYGPKAKARGKKSTKSERRGK
ncbi:MAG TPA: hypothetical protein VGL37_07680 [Solirubrobacteraceae bacterium]|jgi:hypothetical protein